MVEVSPEFFQHAQQVQDYLTMNLSEADTRVYLIDPVLRLLGYTKVDDLRREVPVPATKEFLDYELYAGGKAQAIVEAKALRIPVTDQAAAQCVQYAAVLGVRWCIISNGVSWAFYNAHASGPLADKKVAQVRLDGDAAATAEAWEVLALFSRDSLTQASPMSNLLAERVITDELTKVDSPAVQALRRAIRDRFGERVAPQAIVEVIAKFISRPRSVAAVTPPSTETAAALTPKSTEQPNRADTIQASTMPDPGKRIRDPRTEVLKPDGTRVSIQDLIRAGLVPVDAALEATFDGVTHIARVRADGVEFGGVRFSNLSAAAAAARGHGSSNGWIAWLYQGRPVGELRQELVRQLAPPADSEPSA